MCRDHREDDDVPSRPDENSHDREAEWVRTHLSAVLTSARRVAAIYHRLDAALTVAHVHGAGSDAALVVKYEVEDGLVDDLERFRRDALIDQDIDGVPRPEMIRELLEATFENLDQNKTALTRSGSADTAALQALLWQFRDLNQLLSALVDDTLALLLAR